MSGLEDPDPRDRRPVGAHRDDRRAGERIAKYTVRLWAILRVLLLGSDVARVARIHQDAVDNLDRALREILEK